MRRYLEVQLQRDLKRKTVVLTGPRQVGKTTLARQLMAYHEAAQYLNWDVASDRAILARQSWNPRRACSCSMTFTRCPAGNPG